MKILIFLPNYIGDILQSTPAIKFLKDNLPNVEIGVVAREDRKQLLEDNPDISRVIFKNNLRQLLAEVNQFGPEAIILFRTTFYNCLITSIVQPHFSIGFRQDLSFLFLKKTLPPDSGLSYRAGCYLLVKNFLEEAGQKNVSEINLEKIIFAGWDSPEVIESVRRKLREKRVAPQKNMIVLNPFSSRKTKMLLPGQYVELIKFLLEKFGREYELVIVGNKTEQLIVEHLFNNFPVKNFAGELNLKELGYLLSQAKLFISPDSGPAYIAQAVSCPTVMFFTSTLPERFGPYPENVKIVYQPEICSPCYKNKCNKNYRCVREFPLNLLEEKILEFLG